jgi:hypothetical protein
MKQIFIWRIKKRKGFFSKKSLKFKKDFYWLLEIENGILPQALKKQ